LKLSVYLSSLLSLLIATMLGFLDDVFDIRWRHKVPIPIIASIPLLIVYYADNGNTHIVVPIPFRPLFGSLLNLGTTFPLVLESSHPCLRMVGPLYYLYMSLLSTFSTNSINILAGINGSEASQAVVIALSVILNDLLYLPWPTGFRVPLHLLGSRAEVEVGGVWGAGMAYGSTELVERHLFSLYFMLPLVGVCLGFLFHNWCVRPPAVQLSSISIDTPTNRYPSRAFPGDTLCYVTGMAFAVVGIQAHFSKTLLLFFLPQIFNFVLSCPQLFGLVPCPRHRVPRYDAHTKLNSAMPTYANRSFDSETHYLHPSKTQFMKRASRLSTVVLRVLAVLGFTELTTLPDGTILEATNLTLFNVLLLHFGPMREKRLTQTLIAVQVRLLAFSRV
jgi:UDP-N-acetylglucosamine--dolichyl-phosphate N-acetylglucosaminephosphotransferase